MKRAGDSILGSLGLMSINYSATARSNNPSILSLREKAMEKNGRKSSGVGVKSLRASVRWDDFVCFCVAERGLWASAAVVSVPVFERASMSIV